MNVITLKDYADQKNVSYEAVRKQVARYANELGDHIIKDGRQQFLDEEAVAFLDSKRQKNPVVIYQQDKDDTIEQLRIEKENHLIKIAEQANTIAELSVWKAEKSMLIAEAELNHRALKAAEEETKLLEGFIQDAKNEIATLTEEKALEAARASEASQKAAEAAQKVLELQAALQAKEDENAILKVGMEALEKRTLLDFLLRRK